MIVEIEFYDKDILDTLLPMKTLMPDKVYLFIEKNKMGERIAANIKRVLNKWNPESRLEFIPEEMTGVTSLTNSMDHLMSSLSSEDCDVYIDLSGGNSMMTSCAFSVSLSYSNVTPVFIDLKCGVLREVYDLNIISPLNHLTIDDHLMAIGAKRSPSLHPISSNWDEHRMLELSKYAISHKDGLYEFGGSTFITHRAHHRTYYDHNNFTAGSFPYKFWKKLADTGILHQEHDGSYYVACQYSNLISITGTWLELYVYYNVKALFEEAYMSFTIDWNAYDDIDIGANEIDVIAIKDSIPLLISCKFGRVQQSHIYDISFLSRYLTTGYGKALIVTDSKISHEEGQTDMIKHAHPMNVGIISIPDMHGDLSQQAFKKQMEQALSIL